MSDLPVCPNCQALHDPSEAICWMCRHKFWASPNAPKALIEKDPAPQDAAPRPQPAPPIRHEPKRGPYTQMPHSEPPGREGPADGWTQPIMIVAFILVLMGLFAGPQKGTALIWLGIAPAFFATALAGFRQPKRAPDEFLPKLQYIITKIASVVAIIILVAIALILALAAACAAIIAGFGALAH